MPHFSKSMRELSFYDSVFVIGLGDKTMKFQGDTDIVSGSMKTHWLLSLPGCVASRVGRLVK